MNTQHIYWFAHYGLSCPSTRYRGLYPLNFLAEHHDISYDFVYPERKGSAFLKFLWLYFSILFFRKKDSLIVIQKVCSNGFYANALKLLVWIRNTDTIYDLDDAEQYRQPTSTLHHFLKACSRITTGSTFLHEYAAQFNKNVDILTSPVVSHGFEKSQRNHRLHIGWVGDFGAGEHQQRLFSHRNSMFQILFPAIRQLDFPITLSIIGVKNPLDVPRIKEYFADCHHVHLNIPENLSWEEDTWVYEEIARFDVAVSPLVDHPFTQAKSAFKAKQCLSVGVPVIASDVGENHVFVHHGKNGLLCSGSVEFEEAFAMINNLSLDKYWQMSIAALSGKPTYSLGNYCGLLLRNEVFATLATISSPTKEIHEQRNFRTTTHRST